MKAFVAIIGLLVLVLAVNIVSAETFKMGSYSVNVNFGSPNIDANMTKMASENLDGTKYTDYDLSALHRNILIRQFDTPYDYSTNPAVLEGIVKQDLIVDGCDKDTISTNSRVIDGKPGNVGVGYLTKGNTQEYVACFGISPKAICTVHVWGNQTEMISALKTIHVTEAA